MRHGRDRAPAAGGQLDDARRRGLEPCHQFEGNRPEPPMSAMNCKLTGISSMATREFLAEVADAWRQLGGAVAFESVGGVAAAKRVLDGESLDVVVLAAGAIDKLVAAGRVVPGTKVDLLNSSVAIAVRAGAPRPAIDSEAALRQAVLSARTIGYSTGPSGDALLKLFEQWGIAASIRPCLVQAVPGVAVGLLIDRGDVELGFQQLSELMHLDGIDVIGPMPPGLEIVTTFSGGVCSTTANAGTARALLEFIRSPTSDAAKLRYGMQPVRS